MLHNLDFLFEKKKLPHPFTTPKKTHDTPQVLDVAAGWSYSLMVSSSGVYTVTRLLPKGYLGACCSHVCLILG